MTSGGVEQVADSGRDGHSVFAYYLLRTLTQNTEPYLDASDVFTNVRRSMRSNAQQRPLYAPILDAGDEDGQFIFRRVQR